MKSEKKTFGSSIRELTEYEGQDKVISSFDLSDILKQTGNYEYILHSQLPYLDRCLDGGFESGELITISAPPKTGKTLLAQTLTTNFLDQHQYALWFQYEVTPRRFLNAFPDLPKFYIPMRLEANDLLWLKNRILEGIYKHGISAVFIDHLHFLFDMLTKGNMSLEIGRVVRFLKQLAIEHNIVIFLICHMTKIARDQEPDDSHIRDSSLVGAESDTVLILWRDAKKENQAVLKVRYARRSGAMDKKIRLIKANGLLRELEYADS